MLTSEFLPVRGGVGNYVLQVSKRMPSDIEIHLIAPNAVGAQTPDSRNELRALPDNVHVHLLGSSKNSFLDKLAFQIECLRVVPKMVKDFGIDIIHSQSEMPDLLISPEKVGAPIVTTIHTTVEGHIRAIRATGSSFGELNSSEKITMLASPFLVWAENRYYRGRSYFLTVSNWARRQMSEEKAIDSRRIRVVYIGVDRDLFNPSKRITAPEHFSELADVKAPKVLFFSRLATRKGLGLLMKAIPRITQKVDAHFVLAGSGRSSLFDVPHKDCTLLGYVHPNEVPYLYASSDVFILPSLYENFPASILEAMATQCAVISSDVGGVAEMVVNGRNGITIPPGDVDSIVDSVTRLVGDERFRDELGKSGRETVEERFRWEETALQTADYYREVCKDYASKG